MTTSTQTPEATTMAFAMDSLAGSHASPTQKVGVANNSLVEDGERTDEGSSPAAVSPESNSIDATPVDRGEMDSLSRLNKKRLALRQQRFSLEQRLYEFCGSTAQDDIGENMDVSGGHVVDMEWKDRMEGLLVTYTGPVKAGNIPHGQNGLLKFSDGQVYEGSVVDGRREGLGTNHWPDGQEYTGHWTNNSRNGRGTHIWPDGRKATGFWKDGHLDGKVYFSWPSGATFDGHCLMGKKHGRGLHTHADGRVYSGSFEDGKEAGFGTLTSPDGITYRGLFRDGLKNGYGVQVWKSRTYEGEWVNNKPHGQGRVVWANGATFTGQFQNGKYDGLGVYCWASGKKFVGRWKAGIKDGHGLYTWPNGKRYDGNYSNGMRNGYGRMQWADGTLYCGTWVGNQRHGNGILTSPTGAVLHSELWAGDRPVYNGEEAHSKKQQRDQVPQTVNALSCTGTPESPTIVSDGSTSYSSEPMEDHEAFVPERIAL